MFTQGYTFDDVLLIPKRSSLKSRDDVDLSVRLPKGNSLKLPILSANMKTVTEIKMTIAIANLGGLPILHRFDDHITLLKNFDTARNSVSDGLIGVSVGIKDEDKVLVSDFYNIGCNVICVDVAHGDHDKVYDFVADIRAKYPSILIIAGNVVTETGANHLWSAGADIIKIGVGPGSLCTTRIETGNGYPQLSALDNVCNGCYGEHDGEWPIFIADGGIKSAGDCVKALAFADLVMIGNLFAGTDEAPGSVIDDRYRPTGILDGGSKFKKYEGSSTHKQNHIEGVVALVPYKGKVADVVIKLTEGIRSGCSYQGARNLKELKLDPEFVVISNAGLKESHPHSIIL
jgi:IMP dehydrogenase